MMHYFIASVNIFLFVSSMPMIILVILNDNIFLDVIPINPISKFFDVMFSTVESVLKIISVGLPIFFNRFTRIGIKCRTHRFSQEFKFSLHIFNT